MELLAPLQRASVDASQSRPSGHSPLLSGRSRPERVGCFFREGSAYRALASARANQNL
jgi:hypothetical protein